MSVCSVIIVSSLFWQSSTSCFVLFYTNHPRFLPITHLSKPHQTLSHNVRISHLHPVFSLTKYPFLLNHANISSRSLSTHLLLAAISSRPCSNLFPKAFVSLPSKKLLTSSSCFSVVKALKTSRKIGHNVSSVNSGIAFHTSDFRTLQRDTNPCFQVE
jgi:hypothetical protein